MTSHTNNGEISSSSECIERLRSSISASEFGYKIQALAAHVLARLGHRIDAINQTGHPDVATFKDGKQFHFEVEAQVTGPRPRKLTDADFASLMQGENLVGYYALAVSFPKPFWVLVPASRLVNRRLPSPNVLLEALQEKAFSAEWTGEFVKLLTRSCREVRLAPFGELSRMALTGRGL